MYSQSLHRVSRCNPRRASQRNDRPFTPMNNEFMRNNARKVWVLRSPLFSTNGNSYLVKRTAIVDIRGSVSVHSHRQNAECAQRMSEHQGYALLSTVRAAASAYQDPFRRCEPLTWTNFRQIQSSATGVQAPYRETLRFRARIARGLAYRTCIRCFSVGFPDPTRSKCLWELGKQHGDDKAPGRQKAKQRFSALLKRRQRYSLQEAEQIFYLMVYTCKGCGASEAMKLLPWGPSCTIRKDSLHELKQKVCTRRTKRINITNH